MRLRQMRRLPAAIDPPSPATLRVEAEDADLAAKVAPPQAVPPPHVVPRLSPAQLSKFREEGFLVLPAALDPALLAAARDHVWRVLGAEVPRLRRGEPSSWAAFSADELAAHKEMHGPFGFSVYNRQQFHVRCGADELFLDLFPRALFSVAEQLLGAGTVAWPGGVIGVTGAAAGAAGKDEVAQEQEQDSGGLCRGPCFLDSVHWGRSIGGSVPSSPPPPPPPMRTEMVAIERRGPVWLNASGSRGVYVRQSSPDAVVLNCCTSATRACLTAPGHAAIRPSCPASLCRSSPTGATAWWRWRRAEAGQAAGP